MTELQKYTFEMTQAVMSNGMYFRDHNRASSLARDFGYGIARCGATEKQMIDICKETYGSLLVRGTGLQPPFDMKVWARYIKTGFNKFLQKDQQ